MKNYRSANLPAHCGSCVHLCWDEESCYCGHHGLLCDDTIREWLADDDGPIPADEKLQLLAGDFARDHLDDDDSGRYDHVCDLHSTDHAAEVKSYAEYAARFVAIWRAEQ